MCIKFFFAFRRLLKNGLHACVTIFACAAACTPAELMAGPTIWTLGILFALWTFGILLITLVLVGGTTVLTQWKPCKAW
jgi:hypothetical protein